MVKYVCPKCGATLTIGLEVVVGGPAKHKCRRCGAEMEKKE